MLIGDCNISRVLIESNHFVNNFDNQVFARPGCDNVKVRGNHFGPNRTGPITFTSSNATMTISGQAGSGSNYTATLTFSGWGSSAQNAVGPGFQGNVDPSLVVTGTASSVGVPDWLNRLPRRDPVRDQRQHGGALVGDIVWQR